MSRPPRHGWRPAMAVALSAAAALATRGHWWTLPGAAVRCFAAPSGGQRAKVPKSALVVIPPVGLWDPIQKLRQWHDKGFYRWMPHINLLYPFYEDAGSTFDQASEVVASALADVQPFTVRLRTIKAFVHTKKTPQKKKDGSMTMRTKRKSATLWLDPAEDEEGKAGLEAISSALVDAFPDCTDLSDDPERNITGYVPHLSIGQWPGKGLKSEIEEANAAWEALEFPVESAFLISRKRFEDPFAVRWEVPIGQGPGSRIERNSEYTAALSAAEPPPGLQLPKATTYAGKAKDRWKAKWTRPGADHSKQVKMDGLQWGLFD